MAYEVEVADFVTERLIEAVRSERVLKKIEGCFDLLADFPDIGRPYDPEYPASRPPFACRRIAVPDTPFSLYYAKDDDRLKVFVFYVEYQGADPLGRFAALD